MNNQFSKWSWAAVLSLVLVSTAHAAGTKGVASQIPAYYDHVEFTIQFVEFPSAAEQRLLSSPGLNNIWQSDQAVNAGFPFVSVIDAIPTDGFNPIWQEIQITFNVQPFQLFSDDEIAMAKVMGLISTSPTTEVYWCPIVGPGNH